MFEPNCKRELKPEAVAIIRHVVFSHSGIDLGEFLHLYANMFVLISGQSPEEDKIPSPSTIQVNIVRLNNINVLEIKDQYAALATRASNK